MTAPEPPPLDPSLAASVRQAISLLRGEPKGPWVIVLALALLVGVMEAAGAGLVFAVIGLVVSPDSAITLPIIGQVGGFEDVQQGRSFLLRLVLGVALFFLVRAGVVIGQVFWQYRVIHITGVRLSGRLLDAYLARPLEVHLQRNSSDMIRNIYETVQLLLAQVFSPMVVILTESLIALAMVAVLLSVQLVPTVVAVAFLAPLLVVIFRLLQPRLVRLGRESQDYSAAMLRSLTEALEGIRDIKVVQADRYFADRFLRHRTDHAVSQYRRLTLLETPRVLVETIVMLFVLGLFGTALQQTGEIGDTLAVLGLFGYAALRVMPSLNRVVTSFNSLRAGAAPIADVAADLPTPEPVALAVPRREPRVGPPMIELRDVSFRYQGATAQALTDINATFAPGSFVGFIGPTGGGKSTLLNVLLGLLPPASGAVLVDGEPLVGGWGGRVGLVPQTVFLLDDTVTANVAFGIPKADIDMDTVWQCLATAQVDDVVRDLPNGPATTVGEAGARLSGGQRQRLAIARALYRRPSVLVFDEGTSALDSATEAAVMDALDSLHGKMTLIVVAHRLSTVHNADLVLLLREGRAVDTGTLDDLQSRHPSVR